MSYTLRELRKWDVEVQRQADEIVTEFCGEDAPIDLLHLAVDLERNPDSYDDGPTWPWQSPPSCATARLRRVHKTLLDAAVSTFSSTDRLATAQHWHG
jgi:hypothetical protein